MGLAIDGNEVHGIAKGGQAFLPIDKNNEDGSITYNGQKYIDLANASLNITRIVSTLAGSDAFTNVNITLSKPKNFSEYSFYQIRVLDDKSQNTLDALTQPFSIKPNVRMSISAATDQDSFTINMLADNSGINLSFQTNVSTVEIVRIILYGFK